MQDHPAPAKEATKNLILSVRLSISGKSTSEKPDTADIDTVEGLSFRFRSIPKGAWGHRTVCVSRSENYRAEYPLHRQLYRRALAVAANRLGATRKQRTKCS